MTDSDVTADRGDGEDDGVLFGGVYFRKTNPPREDWERDHRVAAADGHRLFRHWAPWGAVEVAPGTYAWEDYDRQLDLAAEQGIHVVLAEHVTDVPEWLFHREPQARRERRDGSRRPSEMHVSCVTGGHHAMCLDNPEVADAAAAFLVELARRYRNHPALYGYDIWNECTFYSPDRLCYCPATQDAFRRWLQDRYGQLPLLTRAWKRYSHASWSDVELPRTIGPYPDVLDAIAFHNDNAFEWMRWRAQLLRREDPAHPIIAHGNARSFADIAPACGDDWRAAEVVDVFGYTYWYNNRCHPMLAGDLIRSASGSRPFWRAEAIGDADWQDRRAADEPKPEQDAMSDPENIRLDCLISLAAGARAYMTPRWRPLLDGPLFGAYGWYGMDGSRTDRSQMVAELAAWAAQEHLAPLWRSRPLTGEVGLLLVDEAQAHAYATYGNTDAYSLSLQGAHHGFLDAGVQCDPIRAHQLDSYPLVYVPFPVALHDATVSALTDHVAAGGTLVAEACVGYFDGHAHAQTSQPNRGLEHLFGCVERRVSFGADRWNDLEILTGGEQLPVGAYRQSYDPTRGTAVGWFDDGEVAIVDNTYQGGRTRLVGSMAGYGYVHRPSEAAARWFASALELHRTTPRLEVDPPGPIARVSSLDDDLFVWIVNEDRAPREVTVRLRDVLAPTGELRLLRGLGATWQSDGTLVVSVAGRDATIIEVPTVR